MNVIFKKHAQNYATECKGLVRLFTRYRPYICPFGRLLEFVPQRARVLDIGCGTGFFLYLCHILRNALFIAGADASTSIISQAKSIAIKNYRSETYTFKICTTPQDWPDMCPPPTVVSMIDVLHHVHPTQQKDFINTAAYRLAPGGILLIKEMLPSPFWAGAMNRLHDLIMTRQWINYVDFTAIVPALTEQNFEIIHTEKIRLYWYSHIIYVLHKKMDFNNATF